MSARAVGLLRLAVTAALSAGLLGIPAAAQAAPSPCPLVEFLGLHGLNEGSSGGIPDGDHWGATVDDLWGRFRSSFPDSPDALGASAVDYPRTTVAPAAPWNVADVKPATDTAADALQAQLLDLRLGCPGTFIVIAGFSQGAWAVDMAIRNVGRSSDELIRSSLDNVVGIFLMGDPAWPFQDVDRSGLATRFGAGYPSPQEYLDNEVPDSRFRSICLSFSDGRFDPICLSNPADLAAWERTLPAHYEYASSGVTQNGADFLAQQALDTAGAR